MVKVKLNPETNKWERLPDGSPDGIYIHHKLKDKLDNIKKIQARNWDCMFIICGIEGGGKSTLGKLCMWYLSNGTATINNIAANAQEAFDKLKNLPDESPLLIDEGELMFSAKDSMRTEQKQLLKILQVIRQKRMSLIVVCPDFFDLQKYLAVHRSRFVLRAVTDRKLTRGTFLYWGERRKKLLFEMGKRNFNSYTKPKREWAGDFTDFKVAFEAEYDLTKKKSLASSFENKAHELDKTTYYAVIREKIKKSIIANGKEKKPLSFKQISRFYEVSDGLVSDIAKEIGFLQPQTGPYIEYKRINAEEIPEGWDERGKEDEEMPISN